MATRKKAAKKTTRKPARKTPATRATSVKRKSRKPAKSSSKTNTKKRATARGKVRVKAETASTGLKAAASISDLFLPMATPELSEKQRNILKVESLPQYRSASQKERAAAAGVTPRYYRDVIREETFQRYQVQLSRAILRTNVVQVARAYVDAGFEGGPMGRPMPDVLERILEQEKVLEPKKSVVVESDDVSDEELINRLREILGSTGAGEAE